MDNQDMKLEQIKQEIYQHLGIQIDGIINLPNAFILKQSTPMNNKPHLKSYLAIYVELKDYNNDTSQNINKVSQNQINLVLSENTLEVKHLLSTSKYIYKQSAYQLQELNQWRIQKFQEKEGIYQLLSLATKIFSISQKFWNCYNNAIDLSFNNLALDDQQNAFVFNQSNIIDIQKEKELKLKESLLNYGSFLCSLLKDCSQYVEQTSSNQTILRNICNIIEVIFKERVSSFEELERYFYECIVLSMLACVKIENNYQQKFNEFKSNRSETIVNLPVYYKDRDLDFNFKEAKAIENQCQRNIEKNIDVQKNLLILSSIYCRYFRNFSKTITYLNSALSNNPYDIDILIGFIMIFIQKRDQAQYSVIRYTLQSLSQIYEDYWRLYYLISWLYDRDSMYQESQKYMVKTQRLNNTDAQVISLDAIIHLCQKHNQLSQELIRKALEQNKCNHPIVFFRMGYILDDLNIDDSLQWYQKSLEVDPFAADIYFNIAYYYSEKNEIEKSIEQYQKCIEIDPYYVNAYLNQENNYNRLQETAKQEECLKKAIEIDPNNFKTYLNLGVCYEQQQKYSEAMALWKKSIQLNPSHPDAYGLIAYWLYSNNEIKSSIWYYKKYNDNCKVNEKEAIFSLAVLHQLNFDNEESEKNAFIYAKQIPSQIDINSVINVLYSNVDFNLPDLEGDEVEVLDYQSEEESDDDDDADDDDLINQGIID